MNPDKVNVHPHETFLQVDKPDPYLFLPVGLEKLHHTVKDNYNRASYHVLQIQSYYIRCCPLFSLFGPYTSSPGRTTI